MSRRAAYDLSNDNKNQNKNIENIEEIVEENPNEHGEVYIRDVLLSPCHGHAIEDAGAEFALLDREYSFEDSSQNQKLCKFAPFDRKRAHEWQNTVFNFLIVFMILLVILNATATFYIIRQFGIDGKGIQGINLLNHNQIRIEKDVRITRQLVSDNIVADNSLKIKPKNGTITLESGRSKLRISSGRIVAITDAFEVHNHKVLKERNSSRAMYLGLGDKNKKSVTFDVQRLKLNDINKLPVLDRLETRLIDPGKFNELRISSLTGNLTIVSKQQTAINSHFGPVAIIANETLRFRSTHSSLIFESAGGIIIRGAQTTKVG